MRAREGITIQEAAERTGVSRHTLAALERGDHKAMLPTLAKIAEGYSVPVETLLITEGEPAVPLDEAPEAGLQLESMYVATDEQRRAALAAASEEERARYAATIGRVIRDVLEGTLREGKWSPGADETLWKHLGLLAKLRAEADVGVEEPSKIEKAKFIREHAGARGVI